MGAEKARLELAVLLFPDPRTPFELTSPEGAAPLPSHSEAEQSAAKSNPELKSALVALSVSNADVESARAAYLGSIAPYLALIDLVFGSKPIPHRNVQSHGGRISEIVHLVGTVHCVLRRIDAIGYIQPQVGQIACATVTRAHVPRIPRRQSLTWRRLAPISI